MFKIAYSICTKHYLREHGSDSNSEYIKQIYKRNTNWNPPPAPLLIEDSITKFEKLLKDSHNHLEKKFKNTNLSNLTPLQLKALKSLKLTKNLLIKPMDKNLGPALMDLDSYILQVLQEHLLTKDYIQLSQKEALHCMDNLKIFLKDLIKQHENTLPKTELTYFNRSLKSHF
jgi:hypothetical protein